jgi:FAD/FMN-containing dehydrogenase
MEVHVADLTATFGAELALDQLQRQLPEHLWLAVDGKDEKIGDLVKVNATGPLRLGFGGWRDLLLGCQFFNGQDELITAGGRTVKNVAGYDLTKLMVGQAGELGRIATITARLYRRPGDGLLAEFEPSRSINDFLTTDCRPQWAVLTPSALFLGYLGEEVMIDHVGRQLPAFQPCQITRHGFAGDVQWRQMHWHVAGELQMRASVPPARILEFVQSADLKDWIADAAFGIVRAAVDEGIVDRICQSAERVGGRAWFFSGNGDLARFTAAPEERQILQRLKKAMAPRA